MESMARDKKKSARKKSTGKKKATKRTASRKKSPPKFDFKNPTIEQLQTVFVFWCNSNRNILATSKQFGVSRNGIKAAIERYDWNTRFQTAIDKSNQQTGRDVVGGLAKNVARAQKVFDKIGDKLLDKGTKLSADPFAFIRVAKYIDDASGDAPPTTARDIIINVIEQISDATPDERSRFARNYLAGLGVFDDAAVRRLSKILPCKLHSQN